jgi:hypothetical protein
MSPPQRGLREAIDAGRDVLPRRPRPRLHRGAVPRDRVVCVASDGVVHQPREGVPRRPRDAVMFEGTGITGFAFTVTSTKRHLGIQQQPLAKKVGGVMPCTKTSPTYDAVGVPTTGLDSGPQP